MRARVWTQPQLLIVICQDAADDLAKSALDLLGVLGNRNGFRVLRLKFLRVSAAWAARKADAVAVTSLRVVEFHGDVWTRLETLVQACAIEVEASPQACALSPQLVHLYTDIRKRHVIPTETRPIVQPEKTFAVATPRLQGPQSQ